MRCIIATRIIYTTLVFILSLASNSGFSAEGTSVATNILEIVRIQVNPIDSDINKEAIQSKESYLKNKGIPISGTVISTHVDCINCKSVTHFYGESTQLVNPFGTKRPITDLESWSGSKAEVHYRTTDNHIFLIKILP